jgi:hypothetical protein
VAVGTVVLDDGTEVSQRRYSIGCDCSVQERMKGFYEQAILDWVVQDGATVVLAFKST